MEMEEPEGFSVLSYIPIPKLPYDQPATTYTLVEMEDPGIGQLDITSLVLDCSITVYNFCLGPAGLGGGGGFALPPPWEFQPFKIEYCSLYACPSKMSFDVLCPHPLGDFSKRTPDQR